MKHRTATTGSHHDTKQKKLISKLEKPFLILIIISSITLNSVALFRVIVQWSDFTQDYLAADQLRLGEDIYKRFSASEVNNRIGIPPSGSRSVVHDNFHPPFNALLFAPLSFFPYRVAVIVWSLFSIMAYLLVVMLVVRELDFKLPTNKFHSMIGFFLLLSWYPFYHHLKLGGNSLLIILLIMLAWRFYHRNSQVAAGILIGLATAIKMFPGLLLIYHLLKREWKLGIAASASFFLANGILLVAGGLSALKKYFFVIVPENTRVWGAAYHNVSLYAFVSRLMSDNPYVEPIINNPILNRIVFWVTALFFLIALLFFIRDTSLSRKFPMVANLQYSLVLVTMVILSPISWSYNFLLLLLPLACLWMDIKNFPRYSKEKIFFTLIVLLLSLPDNIIASFFKNWTAPHLSPAWVSFFFLSTGFYGLLSCFILLIFRLQCHKKRAITI